MDKLFLTILNMSLTGAFVIVAIGFVRPLLRKAPKIISYCLWAVAGFRLVCPFSIESIFSLVPFRAQAIPSDIAMQTVPRINSGVTVVDNIISDSLPAPELGASVNPLQIWTAIGAFVWLAGAVIMLIYGVVSFLVLKRKMRKAVCVKENIYTSEYIETPFVLGIFSPKIYLPADLSGQERWYILLHEQTHIRRRDHLVKFAAYLVLCLHWFNPLAWAAFLLMGVDMEMSCDERVLKEIGGEIKRDYSLSLLSLATKRRIIGGSPLAFGEGGMKARIKNVLKFKKSSRMLIMAAVAVALVFSIGLLADRTKKENTGFYPPDESPRTYYLENPTERQKFERLRFVRLYSDGRVEFLPALISSYTGPKCTSSITNDELLIHAVIENDSEEGAYGVKNGDVIARFRVEDEQTLVFLSADVPLFADAGARYVYKAVFETVSDDILTVSDAAYEAREWLDYSDNAWMMPLPGTTLELEVPEYPDTVFRWTPDNVTAVDSDGEKELIFGMPVWNVYLADLTGDGLPEFCATVSIGSGMIDERIIVCDYITGNAYTLSDRGFYDYVLFLDNGRLMVKQTKHPTSQNDTLATGELAIVDGGLTAIGIDRTKPDS